MASARAAAQQQTQLAPGNPATQPSFPADSPGDAPLTGPEQAFVVESVERDGEEWGKLRGKSAEGNVAGQRDKISEEYRKRVEAYFKVLAERAKLGK